MKSRSYLILLAVVVLTGLAIWGYIAKKQARGIPLEDGIRLVYSATQMEESKEMGRTFEEDWTSTISTLLRRTAHLGASVYARGAYQIVVDLPGSVDMNEARIMIGSTGRLYGYHAKNVSTATQRRRYERSETITVDGAPVEMFMRSAGGDPFGPDDPEYATMIEGWDVIIQGQDLKRAAPLVRQNGNVVPEFRFSSGGAKKMEAWTRKYRNRGENLAFVIDGVVYTIAPIQDNVILTDEAFIDGQFDPKAVKALCQLLNSGALDVNLSLISEEIIDVGS